jgi:ATP-dependent Clp protease adaptor protein ClpS
MGMKLYASTQTEELVQTLVEESVENKIVLFDDDENTFDFVIDSLVEVCGHDSLQAEQCTIIVHYKGKCEIKKGSFDYLEPMCVALLDRGLTASIQ